MLGLYVSSHPLDGAERILERNCDHSLAELLAGSRTEGNVKIAGIIGTVDRKVTKNGDTWAIITLEDLDAGIECLFFPKAYMLYATELVADRVVSVTGRINERDGAVTIYGETLEILDVSMVGSGLDSPVVISLPEVRVNPTLVQDLKQILVTHPGKAPVHLRLQPHRPGAKGILINLEKFQVSADTAFFGDVKHLLGPSAIGT
jgi:DNA polymerase-3 subunit alpha